MDKYCKIDIILFQRECKHCNIFFQGSVGSWISADRNCFSKQDSRLLFTVTVAHTGHKVALQAQKSLTLKETISFTGYTFSRTAHSVHDSNFCAMWVLAVFCLFGFGFFCENTIKTLFSLVCSTSHLSFSLILHFGDIADSCLSLNWSSIWPMGKGFSLKTLV